MKKTFLLILFLPFLMFAQKTTILKGTVKNKDKKAIENVSVEFGSTGTVTDKEGNYSLRVPFKKEIVIKFSHISYRTYTHKTEVQKVEMQFASLLF